MPHSTAPQEPPRPLLIAAFAALYIIWGSTYMAIYIAIQEIPPFLMAGFRFFSAGIILYGWCRWKGEATPPLRSLTRISLAGILMLFAGTGSLVWVEQFIPTGLAAIIIATVPLWFVILDKKQWAFHFSNKWIVAGLLIGFGGVLSLFFGKTGIHLSGDRVQASSVIILLVGSMIWAAGSLYAKYSPASGSTGMKAAFQMMAAGGVSLLTGLLAGEGSHFSLSGVSGHAWLAVGYLISFGSLIGYMSYVWLLSVRPASIVGTYAYVNPVVAVLLGWLLIGEKMSIHQVVALAVILFGVLIVNITKVKKDHSL